VCPAARAFRPNVWLLGSIWSVPEDSSEAVPRVALVSRLAASTIGYVRVGWRESRRLLSEKKLSGVKYTNFIMKIP